MQETEVAPSLLTLRRRIWKLCKQSIINVNVAANKASVRLPLASIEDAEAILAVLTKPRRKAVPLSDWARNRYCDAHRLWFAASYKEAFRSGHYTLPVIPKTSTANGLTNFALNFITWHGYRATRVSSSGRKIGDKWIRGTTRPGSADISATIVGKSVMLEIKVGPDKPSEKQLKEQARERAAGGVYEFCRSPEDVINLFDSVVYGA